MTSFLSDFIGNVKATTLGNKIFLGAWLLLLWVVPIIILLDLGGVPWKVFLVIPLLSLLITMVTIEIAN